MPTDVTGYSKTVITHTDAPNNTQNILTVSIPEGQTQTYAMLFVGGTSDFKYVRKWVLFTVYNNGGTAAVVDGGSGIIDIIAPYSDAGFSSPPGYSFSVTTDVLTVDVTGPDNFEQMQWKVDIQWSII